MRVSFELSQRRSRLVRAQQGVFLVLFAIVAVALLAMLGLMIGSGFLAANKTLLQNASNNTAMAAIEGYSSTRSANFFLRSCVARTRAERVLELNDLKGFELTDVRLEPSQFMSRTDIGNLLNTNEAPQLARCTGESNPGGDEAAGLLTFGRWIENKASDPANNPPGSDTGTERCRVGGVLKYPCFVADSATGGSNVPVTTQVSAVRVDLNTSSELPFFIPLVGQSDNVSARSFGVVVPRCFAGVVDLSYSSVNQTHPVPTGRAILPGTVYDQLPGVPGIQLCPACGTSVDAALASACQGQYGDDDDAFPLNPACPNSSGPSSSGPCWADEPGRNGLTPGYEPDNSVDGYFNPATPEPQRTRNQRFLHGGWKRPWLPWRNQRYFPRYNRDLEPPFMGMPFIPLEFLRPENPSDFTSPEFLTEANCDRGLDGREQFTKITWCNMWRGRRPNDPIHPYESVRGTGPNACNLGVNPQLDRLVNPTTESSQLAHFWSDYDPSGYSTNVNEPTWLPRPHQSPYGPLMVDRYVPLGPGGTVQSAGPEPLSRYLSAMNAAFRLVGEQSAAGDRALVLGFAGDLMYRGDDPTQRTIVPPGSPPGTVGDPIQVAVVPGVGMDNANGATGDFALLAQVTNPLGRGVYGWDAATNQYIGGTGEFAEYHPNFIDVGLVSRLVKGDPSNIVKQRIGNTNILKGLLSAGSRLLNPQNGAGCGPGSLKSVVLFTDGINTCAPLPDFPVPAGPPVPPSANPTPWENRLQTDRPPAGHPNSAFPDWFACGSTSEAGALTTYYQRYEQFLFGGWNGGSDLGTQRSSLAALLQEARIAFTAVVDGTGLGATWNRVARPNRQPGESEFLTINELKTASPALKRLMFDSNSIPRPGAPALNVADPEADAYRRAGTDAFFRRPLETLGRLAAETGGIVWPLLPRCQGLSGCSGPEGCYQSTDRGAPIKDAVWAAVPAARLPCSPLNLNESEQAAQVMIESIGQKPYSLRQPVAGDIN